MKIKEETGITNIDLTVSIIMITIFVALIATFMYPINANFISIERKAEAVNYAINEIEALKAKNFKDLKDTPIDGTNDFIHIIENEDNTVVQKETGFSKKITIMDYSNLPENQNDETIISGLVKKVTVEIAYKDKNTIQTFALSTVIAKNH